MTFLESAALAVDPEFVARVGIALMNAAVDVYAEPEDAANHGARLAYAVRVLANPQHEARQMAYGVLTNEAIDAASPDDAIQFTVNSLFDAFAAR